MAKRGQGEIITTILIILLVLAVVVIAWQVIKGTVEKGAEEVKTFSQISDINIREVIVDAENSQIAVTVQKGESSGTLGKLKIVVKNNAGESQVETVDANIGTLETKKIQFAITITNPSEVEVYPVIIAEDGSEKIGSLADKIKSDSKKFVGGAIPGCTPNCGTSVCGLDPTGCGTSCGTCTNGGICSAGQCTLANGLVGYWSFDDGTATDNSVNTNHGTINGAICGSAIPGKIGNACSFDAVSKNYISVPSSTNLNFGTSSFSFSFWIKGGAPAGWIGLIGKTQVWSATYPGWLLGNSPINGLDVRFDTLTGTADVYTATTSANVFNSQWHYITGVRSGNTLTIYVDGISKATLTTTATSVSSTYPLTIGRPSGADNYYFNGQIDEVRIYNRALTASEIDTLSKQA